MIALELFRDGHVSSGKAAKMLGMSKLAFVHLPSQREIPRFSKTVEELNGCSPIGENPGENEQ
jgi:predicted HTH domain antitoxin